MGSSPTPDPPPSEVPLTGADCFLRAFDHEIRRTSGASHVSQLVLRLGPGFDVEIFRKLVEEAARAQPILRAPIGRRLGLAAPAYRVAAADGCALPEVAVHDVERAPDGDALPEVFFTRLNEPLSLRRGELLRFDAVRYAGGTAGTDLAMSWVHMLFDGAGSERFVTWLDETFRGERRVDELPDPGELEPREAAALSWSERGERATQWKRWMDGFAERPPRSLAGPLRRVRQDLRYDVLTLSSEQSERAVESAARRAGFLTPMLFYLAASIRAHHAVFRARGVDPGSYLVPLPVNMRPRGGEGAMFRTHVSLLWFHVPSEQVEDMDELVGALKELRLAAIRAGHVENAVCAMDFARFAPRRLYAHMARRGLGGELCSFFFAFTGDFLAGCERFLGAEIRNGFHVAPVPPSPGSCVAMSLRGGVLNATHVHQRDTLRAGEAAILREQLRADLLS